MLLPPSSLPFITAKGINISLLWAHKALCEFYLIFVCMSVTWHHPSMPAMEGGKAKQERSLSCIVSQFREWSSSLPHLLWSRSVLVKEGWEVGGDGKGDLIQVSWSQTHNGIIGNVKPALYFRLLPCHPKNSWPQWLAYFIY